MVIKRKINLTINGRPQGKARPRLGKGRIYTPQQTLDYEALVGWTYKNKYNVDKMGTDNPLKMNIKAYFKIPKSETRPMKAYLKDKYYPHKPDSDNIAKIVMDGLNGLAYLDDNQVVSLNVEKWYTDEEERVEIEIEEISYE